MSMSDIVKRIEQPASLATVQSIDVGSMLGQIVKSGITADSAAAVKELVLLHEHCQERESRKSFLQAFYRVKEKTSTINATKGIPDRNGAIRWFYAPLEDIQDNIDPLLQAEGLYMRFDSTREGNWITAECICGSAESGYEVKTRCSIDMNKAEGGDLGAFKKAKRGALVAMFGIKTRHVSEDARIMGDFISVAQAEDVMKRVKALGRDERAFLKFAGVVVPPERAPSEEDYRHIRTGKFGQVEDTISRAERQTKKNEPVADTGAANSNAAAPSVVFTEPAQAQTKESESTAVPPVGGDTVKIQAPPSDSPKQGDAAGAITSRVVDVTASNEPAPPSNPSLPPHAKAEGGEPTTAPASGKLTRPEARAKANALVACMTTDQKRAFVMECAGSGDAKVHAAWVKARTLQKIGTRGVVDLLSGEVDSLAKALHYQLLLGE